MYKYSTGVEEDGGGHHAVVVGRKKEKTLQLLGSLAGGYSWTAPCKKSFAYFSFFLASFGVPLAFLEANLGCWLAESGGRGVFKKGSFLKYCCSLDFHRKAKQNPPSVMSFAQFSFTCF